MPKPLIAAQSEGCAPSQLDGKEQINQGEQEQQKIGKKKTMRVRRWRKKQHLHKGYISEEIGDADLDEHEQKRQEHLGGADQ
jgi:hypothetical protein